MRKISVSDRTVRKTGETGEYRLSFRVVVELAKQLDNLGVSVIETCPVGEEKSDYFLVKSIASAVRDAAVSVPVDIMNPDSPKLTWDAVKDAAHPRLMVAAPVSTVQMEYFCHCKPAGMQDLVEERVAACAALCPEVEFVAEDFTRADSAFLSEVISAAVKAGAKVITLEDCSGTLLPDEFSTLVAGVKKNMPKGAKLGVACCNDLHMADVCAVEAVRAGADEIKTSVFGRESTSLRRFPQILSAKRALCKADTSVNITELRHTVDKIVRMCETDRSKSSSGVAVASSDQEIKLTATDDKNAVLDAVFKLGYELNDEDTTEVFDAVVKLAAKNGCVEAKELEAIVASVAFQVPSTYNLESYVINSGNVISATCHLRIRKGEELLDIVGVGDGPVDAAFQAIETLVGMPYELDDFQIRSVTEGREALGETVVKLRSRGRLYPGRGVSTDIVGSSIMAYLNAVNKIAYEEEQA